MTMRALCFLFLLLGVTGAVAAPDPAVKVIVAGSEDVVAAKVDSVAKGKAVFVVTEVLRGKSHGRLVLAPGSKVGKLMPGDRCVLCWQGADSLKGTVDADPDYGDPEWFYVPVHSEADERKLKAWAVSKK